MDTKKPSALAEGFLIYAGGVCAHWAICVAA